MSETKWKTKQAGLLRDHDVIRGHGMVDWTFTVDIPNARQIAAYVHSGDPERGSYTLLFPYSSKVEYTRS